MPFEIIRDDITAVEADAIVNAANSRLAPGGGVCGAIFDAAGYSQLDKACRAIGYCETGQAVVTSGFQLLAKHIIHTVGPVWQGGSHGEEELLRSCYQTSLCLAEEHGCKSIAFPLISSGIYGYPKAEAMRVAVSVISEFLLEHEMRVLLVVFDKRAALLSESLMGSIQSYIDDHYVDAHTFPRTAQESLFKTRQTDEGWNVCSPVPMAAAMPMPVAEKKKRSLKDLLGRMEESFSTMLLRLIDEKGMTDVEVYKRANIDRKLFSKLRREGYNPSKHTAIALAIALRLNLDETKDLLGRAGYALSHSRKFDVIIEYFIVEEIYDVYEINEALFAFDQKLLGA